MGAVDENPLDICRGGWTGVKGGIMAVAELRPAVSVMQIDTLAEAVAIADATASTQFAHFCCDAQLGSFSAANCDIGD